MGSSSSSKFTSSLDESTCLSQNNTATTDHLNHSSGIGSRNSKLTPNSEQNQFQSEENISSFYLKQVPARKSQDATGESAAENVGEITNKAAPDTLLTFASASA